MDKNKITVTMPILEYEGLITDIKYWKNKYSNLENIISKYRAAKYTELGGISGYYIINKNNLVNAIERYLNKDIIKEDEFFK